MLALNGCATSYTLPNGDTRVVGFVAITLPAPTGNKAGTDFRIQNLGLLLYNHPDQKGVSIGYSSMSLLQLENNVCTMNIESLRR